MAARLWTAWQVLRLSPEGFRRWRARQTLAEALALLVAISLLIGAMQTAASLMVPQRPAAVRAERLAGVAALRERLSYLPLLPDVRYEVARNLEAGFEFLSDLEALPRPLGRTGSAVVRTLQHGLDSPYKSLALWLPYSFAVLACARAIGGCGSMADTLSAVALCALPWLFSPLALLPAIGACVPPLLLCWSIAIYVRSVQVSQGLGLPQALLATFLPGAVVVTLGLATVAAVLVVF
jgi:hypothetical protein